MRDFEVSVEDAQSSLEHLARGFSIFAHPDEQRGPQPSEWGGFLCKHASQGYGDEKFSALALELVLDPKILIAFEDSDLQKLGGALIGVTFTQNELKQLANEGI